MRGLDVIEDVIGLGDFLERLKPVMCLAALRMTARNSRIITAHSIKPCRASFTHKYSGFVVRLFCPAALRDDLRSGQLLNAGNCDESRK